jgi:fatty-acyl-CoA synthase
VTPGGKRSRDLGDLACLGLRPGDRAGIWSGNCLEWILVQLGCAMAGVVLVNVNPAYRSVDLGYVLRKSRLRALFLRDRDARANYREVLQEARSGQELPLEHIIFFRPRIVGRYARPRRGPGSRVWFRAGPHDVANIQYTSSSGRVNSPPRP